MSLGLLDYDRIGPQYGGGSVLDMTESGVLAVFRNGERPDVCMVTKGIKGRGQACTKLKGEGGGWHAGCGGALLLACDRPAGGRTPVCCAPELACMRPCVHTLRLWQACLAPFAQLGGGTAPAAHVACMYVRARVLCACMYGHVHSTGMYVACACILHGHVCCMCMYIAWACM